jgi:thiol-disulfide isomerase/thioredoxin
MLGRASLAFVVVATLAACTANAVGGGPQSGDQGYVNGDGTIRVVAASDRDPAPPIRGQALDGGTLDVRDFPGKVVVVNFWASWCPPCRAEQPRLNQVYADTSSQGVVFVGVDIRDSDTSARNFRRTHDVRYPTIVDEPGALLLGFHGSVPGTPPTTVVLDRDGRIAAKIIGESPQGVLKPIVDQLLAEGSGS